jgi:hypothetical protein
MFPALALLIGAALDRLARSRWVWGPLALLFGLLTAALLLLPQQAERRAAELASLGGEVVPLVAAALAALALAAAIGWWLAFKGRAVAAATALAAGMSCLALVLALGVLPRFDGIKSARGLAEHLSARIAAGEPYAIYPRIDPSFVFYSGRFCDLPAGEEELRRWAGGPGRRWLLITKREAAALSPPLPLVEVGRDPDERDGYLLLGPPENP